MEKFDKNYIIGFVLLFLMYGGYMYFYPPTTPEPVTETAVTEQAVEASAQAASTPAQAVLDTAAIKAKFGDFSGAVSGEDKEIVLENKDLFVTLSSKGGAIKRVELKDHKTYDNFINNEESALVLIDENSSKLDLEVQTPTGPLNLTDLYFQVNSNDNKSAVFNLTLANGESIEQTYTLADEGFALDYDLNFNGTSRSIQNQPINVKWENKLKKLENDLEENRKAAQINFYETDGDFEDYGLGSTGDIEETAEDNVNWFTFKQKYFTTGLISENQAFQNLALVLNTPQNDTTIVKDAIVTAQLPMQSANSLKFYFGPNEMKELKDVAPDFHKNLYLGYDIVKPINRFVFVPLFNWLEKFFSNYGFLIIAVVLLIKTTLTPLLYKSYVSSAKMRILAPEIAEIKEKVGDDQVKQQQETMNLYKQVGVSPLSGCVPMLLQMPILMSVFFLFPNMEMFRQKSFLWASDLSTYDAPISWGFDLPVIGNHLSLFVVLMTLSSLAFTYYNNQITPSQPGPIDMKKLSYIFPLVFFFVLNSFPAALSFYYLVSNLVTIAQQLIVRRFVDEDKIRKVLDENKRNYASKPKKKNKFSSYLEKQLQAQEEANRQKAKELKEKKKKR
ncbi:membrane protein insertase YidC [Jiulongibacter sediminis]|uniref:Membrane protein insertase YidC n=1 Tax=Jiulongibacter sediminis TaxID=1605367 RepID=A0A0P7BEN6_9BACT|nr:membrane protein insertase YidC [Jiulongibacter sediminis]KPM49234.1 preprotein translocase subunit YidC [Jiulongibacter sediminis]TBX26288.1 preprotein translocase subunit YidC [Jiulongibacter sediminis]